MVVEHHAELREERNGRCIAQGADSWLRMSSAISVAIFMSAGRLVTRGHERMKARARSIATAAGIVACALPMSAMADSPPMEPWRIVLAIFVTFPLNLVFLPGALVLLSFVARQAVVWATVPSAQRRSPAHRQRTRRWYWALLAGLGFDALALVVILLFFAAH